MLDVQVERRPLNSASSLLLTAEKEGDRPMSGMNHFQVRLTHSLWINDNYLRDMSTIITVQDQRLQGNAGSLIELELWLLQGLHKSCSITKPFYTLI